MRLSALAAAAAASFLGGVVVGTQYSRPTEFNSWISDKASQWVAFADEPVSPPSDDTPLPPQVLPSDQTRRWQQINKLGYPSKENILPKKDFILSYNYRLRQANWVCEHLTKSNIHSHNGEEVSRQKSDFKPDRSIPQMFRATNEDFRKSGYDRGHLAAAANHRVSQEAMDETFLLSNMSPQVGSGFNRDTWELLERHARSLTKIYRNVFIYTGPLFLPRMEGDGNYYVKYQVVGDNRVAVPTHFYKVIAGERDDGNIEVQSFVMPNAIIRDKTPINLFIVPLETVERAGGLIFFDNVPRTRVKQISPIITVS